MADNNQLLKESAVRAAEAFNVFLSKEQEIAEQARVNLIRAVHERDAGEIEKIEEKINSLQ